MTSLERRKEVTADLLSEVPVLEATLFDLLKLRWNKSTLLIIRKSILLQGPKKQSQFILIRGDNDE
jgi:hypothetical protein